MSGITSNESNPLDEFTPHGIKTIGGYDYVLMVDEGGQAVIMRVSADKSEIRYCLMSKVSGSFATIAAAIDAFWVAPDVSKVYTYLFQC